jgi:hypothetical protein
MTPQQMINRGVRALRAAEKGALTYTAGADTASAWAALAMASQMLDEPERATDALGVPLDERPTFPTRARHLDTVRPGPNQPALFHHRQCALPGCTNMATHTIEDVFEAREVCTTHFTEWSNARPI